MSQQHGKFNNTKKKREKEMKAQKDSVKAELRNNLLVIDDRLPETRVSGFGSHN